MRIIPLPYDFTVCQVADVAPIHLQKEYTFLGKTADEISLVCKTEDVPENALNREDGWKAFYIAGVLDFSLIGILSQIASALSENGISIFALSTFNTDYVLVKREDFDRALSLLRDTDRFTLPGEKKLILETERLILREYTMDDFDALYTILSDPVTMQHYPAPYDANGTRRWLQWSMDHYQKYGFGLWAMELKETGQFIGDCGITLQKIDGDQLPEIGYHVHKDYWRKGYAKEAARAVRDWAFTNTPYPALYSYMKYTNVPSYSTARSIGMEKIKEYPDPKDTLLYVYQITRAAWQTLKDQ